MNKFNETINILVKAYLNDTLEHAKCHACAVGNIISASGMPLTCSAGDSETMWLRHIDKHFRHGAIHWHIDEELAIKQIESTGYTGMELSMIERAFERASCGESDDEWMFNGLMAVVNVLAEIHQVSLEQKEEAKLLFV